MLFDLPDGNLLTELSYHELDHGIMYHKDGRYEFGIEISIPNTVFVESFEPLLLSLRALLQDDLEQGGRLRFIQETCPADPAAFAAYRERITAPEPALRRMLEERARLFEADWEAGNIRRWRAYCCVRLGRARKVYAYHPDTIARIRTHVDDLRKRMLVTLQRAGMSPRAMSTDDIFGLCFRYLNPDLSEITPSPYRPTWQRFPTKAVKKIRGERPPTLRAQLAQSNFDNRRLGPLLVGDHYVGMVALHTLPDQETFVTMMDGAERAGRKAYLVVDFFHQPSEKASAVIRGRARKWAGAAYTDEYYVDPETRELAEQSDAAVRHMSASGDHFMVVSCGIVMADDDRAALKRRIDDVYSALDRVPGKPFRRLGQGLMEPFLQFAPFSGQDYLEVVNLTTSSCTHFFPACGPWLGSKEPVAVFRNRYFGLTNLNTFDDAMQNYNGVMVAKSGSGKTFTMLYYLSELLANKDAQVIIIDKGKGYLPLVRLLGGAYIPLRAGGETCINPLDLQPGAEKPTDEEKALLLKVLRGMIPGTVGSEQEVENAVLQSAIEQVYSYAYRRVDGQARFETPTLSMLVDKLRRIDRVGDARASERAKTIAEDLAMRLQAWIGDSPLGRFVDRQTNVPVHDARVVYYDLEGIADLPQLGVVGTMLIANLIWQRLKAPRPGRAMLVLDEGWAIMKESPAAKRLVEELYVRARRYGCGIWSIAQSLVAFMDSPEILSSADSFLGLMAPEKERALWQQHFSLPDRTMELIKKVHTVKGHYSEAICILQRDQRYEGSIIAVHPTAMDYWGFTTEQLDMNRRDALEQELGGLEAALERLAQAA